ncbi:hypothetical protein Y032_0100g3263 [Ancylostoma ceylanicum]|uniref:Uncharacterized protein n=1 Tax=Ancylostoma ceylanicum TaxID=53326 RepID=A0A016TI72_9BILA|nr:hypothetical protein Y032_0100g3263 [Ancylostoma ceylanicum]
MWALLHAGSNWCGLLDGTNFECFLSSHPCSKQNTVSISPSDGCNGRVAVSYIGYHQRQSFFTFEIKQQQLDGSTNYSSWWPLVILVQELGSLN